VLVMLGLLIGAAVGYYIGQPSGGTIIGGGFGGLLAILLTWRDRSR
jgi:hypothetical protein